VIRGAQTLRTTRERVSGFVQGLRDAGLDLDDRLVVETEFTRSGRYAAARQLAATARSRAWSSSSRSTT
jgi:LacI family transcriptional regulator